MKNETLHIIIHENSIRIIVAFITFYFSVFIHIYDMIKNNNVRMLCRSVSESWVMSLSWLVIGLFGFWTMAPRVYKHVYYTSLVLIVCIVLFSNLDYHTRLTKKKYNIVFKICHYISAVLILSLLVFYLKSQGKPSFYPLVCLLLLFFYLHMGGLSESAFRDRTICLELFILYFCLYKILIEDQILQKEWITFNNIILKDKL